jgi:hypothetical protein
MKSSHPPSRSATWQTNWRIGASMMVIALAAIACGGGGGGGVDEAVGQAPVPVPVPAPAPAPAPIPAPVPAPAAPAWTAAQLIETDDRALAKDADVATDSNGNAVAVWAQAQAVGSGVNAIWANRYTTAAGWGTAEVISTDNTFSAEKPKVVSDAQGNTMAVWAQPRNDGSGVFIWAKRYIPATGWGAVEQIGTDNLAGFVQIAQSANGDIVAAWQNSSTTASGGVYANRYFARGGWSGAVQVSTRGDSHKIAMDSSGKATIVWHENIGSTSVRQIRAAVSFRDLALPLVFFQPLSDGSRGSASFPYVATDANGVVTAVWSQSERTDGAGKRGLWTSRYVGGDSSWSGAIVIDTSVTAGSIRDPRVIADKDGNVTALWSPANEGGLWANRYSPTTGWSTATQITARPSLRAGDAQLGISASGKITAVWTQGDTGARDISVWSNQFSPTTGWGTSVLLENEVNNFTDLPRISINAAGKATVVWQQSTGTSTNIWSARFD